MARQHQLTVKEVLSAEKIGALVQKEKIRLEKELDIKIEELKAQYQKEIDKLIKIVENAPVTISLPEMFSEKTVKKHRTGYTDKENMLIIEFHNQGISKSLIVEKLKELGFPERTKNSINTQIQKLKNMVEYSEKLLFGKNTHPDANEKHDKQGNVIKGKGKK